MRYYTQARFDKGARAFGFGCAILYTALIVMLVDAVVTALLKI
jgi:hypothetical protein